ncbi:ShlB/FhaC/HecB family hemolysin secretion/activation protein [Herbaspirillum sp. alder98]|uniref:ShlB/FhaC/HecB family hemolysin secretion/activation protein n=1 Tax=Herbaspirillum sp. alder98 TaxID=2913096 RepID=UPI001CD832B8|nr:ShlB/FhaC/HecB family hemolysin secretion/activation protein [Herbaspirillum sp. alder98]MCA1324579.1 ShlB/FhaC/HecB family hemolysin secretion/activation protein [Herbaspirillum sp. alder98]
MVASINTTREWHASQRAGVGQRARRRLLAIGPLLTLAVSAAHAQSLPGAGELLRDLRPALPLATPDGQSLPPEAPTGTTSMPLEANSDSFAVAGFHIEGAVAFAPEVLAALLDDLVGPQRSLATLDQATARITRFYRDHGYLLARAYLPAQRLDQGQVRLLVLEGRLGEIRLHNASRMDSATLRQRLDRIGLGLPLAGTRLERELLLINDLPGVALRSALTPGSSVGSTDLEVQVADDRRVEGEVSLDNHGNRYTGAVHANAVLALNNPLGIGDQLQFNAISAGSGFNYGRLAYQLPLGASGTTLNLSYAAMAYRVGADFSQLDAAGSARLGSAALGFPLVRSRRLNVGLQLRLDTKRFQDRIGLIDLRRDKRIDAATTALTVEASDGWLGGGQSRALLGLTLGRLHLPAADLADDRIGHRTEGRFAQGNLQATRLQALGSHWEGLVQLSAQYAAGNLDSAQKLSMGGPYAVRAYPSGEAPADDAVMLNLELRRAVTTQWQAFAFADAARGRLNHSPLAADGDNLRNLSGIGLGARWNQPQAYRLQATLAWRTGPAATSEPDKLPRFWLQLAKSF